MRLTEKDLPELNKIQDELGIDLITLFKALKNGIYYKKFNGFDEDGKETYIVAKEDRKLFIDYQNELLFGACGRSYFLDEYGTEWALTKEELI